MAVPNVETVLDVGCGSGFAACYLAASGRYRQVLGVDSSPTRVASATLHAQIAGSAAEFRQSGMTELALPDKSVDLVMTSFALEQTGEFLGDAFAELRRVARKTIVLFEPSTQFFQTLAGMWHLPTAGWATNYYEVLTSAGVAFAVRPNLFNHYYNPGTVFVIDVETDQHPVKRFPQLFAAGTEDWPGGVRIDPA
jgi:ubiquinone/menaquinone biosynthesis C-methylase UbiE